MAAQLLARGLVDGVAHVVPADAQQAGRLFRYRISRSVDALREGAKSRYYPVEMSEVLREIRAVPGRYAVVGIPCFIKAVQLLRRQDALLRERIAFTLGEALAQGRLQLEPVDADFVRRTQAAGLRHRREGLALRLAWRKAQGGRGLQPRKRVAAVAPPLPLWRRLVYRMRAHISRWSHRLYRFAPGLHPHWARFSLAAYQGLAYGHGRLGGWLERVGLKGQQP